jgi:hypothetical protein
MEKLSSTQQDHGEVGTMALRVPVGSEKIKDGRSMMARGYDGAVDSVITEFLHNHYLLRLSVS